MKRGLKWLLGALLLKLLLAAGLALGFHYGLGSNELKQRLEKQASATLGHAVVLNQVRVSLLPLGVALQGVEIQTQPPLLLSRLELLPSWPGLLKGRLELASLHLQGALLPAQAIETLRVGLTKNSGASSTGALGLPRRFKLQDVRWIDAKGEALTLDVQAQLSADGFPLVVDLEIQKGLLEGAKLHVQQQNQGWNFLIMLAGGTIKGDLQFQPAAHPGASFELKAQAEMRDVELAALISSLSPRRVGRPILSGRLHATTELFVRATNLASLGHAMQTHSSFTVRQAVLHSMDLAKAVKTVGLNRGGETQLDVLAGQLNSRGRFLEFTNLVASSGILSATGGLAISARQGLSGRINVELLSAPGVGVPLVLAGTVAAPELNLTRAAVVGAAIGTVLMPGVGTGAGASAGDKMGEEIKKFFGK
ncbi:MAG: hypothetical protein WBI20_00230 [Burkholderiaceae bacterium]